MWRRIFLEISSIAGGKRLEVRLRGLVVQDLMIIEISSIAGAKCLALQAGSY
jgi:hypothetical protein